MAEIRPFCGIRPREDLASSIAALPYDVYTREEARKAVADKPLSFLRIDRAETQLPEDTDMYSQPVYDCAKETFQRLMDNGTFIQDQNACFYLYALTLNDRTQTGLVCCASIDDYIQNRIKRHENTTDAKEQDRIRHVDTLSAHTGPIFLAYKAQNEINRITSAAKESPSLYDFTTEDGVRHQVWKIDAPEDIEKIQSTFSGINDIYIADGHHRAASAAKVALKRREEYPDYDGSEEFNYFLCTLFPAEELRIFDYNRIIKGLNGHTFEEMLNLIRSGFEITDMGTEPYHPAHKGEIALYGQEHWYRLAVCPFLYSDDPVNSLDVSVLQNVVLKPVLGIDNPKSDPRIQFVGGIRGLQTLKDLVDNEEEGVAFAMYPTSMDELLAVADAKRLMPPKSTWFEPKLRSGLFIHQF